MRPGDYEPNEHYRPWLEKNIGRQGIEWQWAIESIADNTLRFEFLKDDDAILFHLTWP